MLLCAVVVCLAQSFLFGHIKSYFLNNKVTLSTFLGHKNGLNMTDCLNFDVSLCIQIKKQISIRGRRNWGYIFCGILDPAAIQDCTQFYSLITNAFLQLVSDIINGVCY